MSFSQFLWLHAIHRTARSCGGGCDVVPVVFGRNGRKRGTHSKFQPRRYTPGKMSSRVQTARGNGRGRGVGGVFEGESQDAKQNAPERTYCPSAASFKRDGGGFSRANLVEQLTFLIHKLRKSH